MGSRVQRRHVPIIGKDVDPWRNDRVGLKALDQREKFEIARQRRGESDLSDQQLLECVPPGTGQHRHRIHLQHGQFRPPVLGACNSSDLECLGKFAETQRLANERAIGLIIRQHTGRRLLVGKKRPTETVAKSRTVGLHDEWRGRMARSLRPARSSARACPDRSGDTSA